MMFENLKVPHGEWEAQRHQLNGVIDALNANAKTFQDFMQAQAHLANTYLFEDGTAPNPYLVDGSNATYTFKAQTQTTELVTAIISFFPSTATGATLQLDDTRIQLPAGPYSLVDVMIPVRNENRIVRWGNHQTTDVPQILICARPLTGGNPGVLH